MNKIAEKDLYWDVVTACLQEIFGIQPGEAAARSLRLRKSIEGSSSKNRPGLFYHAEPLDVAADLACTGKELKKADLKKYAGILAKHPW